MINPGSSEHQLWNDKDLISSPNSGASRLCDFVLSCVEPCLAHHKSSVGVSY